MKCLAEVYAETTLAQAVACAEFFADRAHMDSPDRMGLRLRAFLIHLCSAYQSQEAAHHAALRTSRPEDLDTIKALSDDNVRLRDSLLAKAINHKSHMEQVAELITRCTGARCTYGTTVNGRHKFLIGNDSGGTLDTLRNVA